MCLCDTDMAATTKVIDSRPLEGGRSIRRRRMCLQCKKRLTTWESRQSPIETQRQIQTFLLFAEQILSLWNGALKGVAKEPEKMSSLLENLQHVIQEDIKPRQPGQSD